MKKVYSYKEMKAMDLKKAPRLSPVISGVVRSNIIVITPSEISSGIKSYHNRETEKGF